MLQSSSGGGGVLPAICLPGPGGVSAWSGGCLPDLVGVCLVWGGGVVSAWSGGRGVSDWSGGGGVCLVRGGSSCQGGGYLPGPGGACPETPPCEQNHTHV